MYNIINKDIQLPILSHEGKEVSKVKLDSEIFGVEPHMPSVHLAVRVHTANVRQATAKTKTRSEVSGGGKKPWRQKGTGRARAGSSRSPIWVHGGTVFGPTGIQNFKLKMNKRVHARAIVSVLSDKVANNNLVIVKEGDLKTKSTKAGLKLLTNLGLNSNEKILVVLDCHNEYDNLVLSLRNFKNLYITCVDDVPVYEVLNANKLVMTEGAVKEIQGLEEAPNA